MFQTGMIIINKTVLCLLSTRYTLHTIHVPHASKAYIQTMYKFSGRPYSNLSQFLYR